MKQSEIVSNAAFNLKKVTSYLNTLLDVYLKDDGMPSLKDDCKLAIKQAMDSFDDLESLWQVLIDEEFKKENSL